MKRKTGGQCLRQAAADERDVADHRVRQRRFKLLGSPGRRSPFPTPRKRWSRCSTAECRRRTAALLSAWMNGPTILEADTAYYGVRVRITAMGHRVMFSELEADSIVEHVKGGYIGSDPAATASPKGNDSRGGAEPPRKKELNHKGHKAHKSIARFAQNIPSWRR